MAGKSYVPYSISKEELRFSYPVDVDYSEPLAKAIEANTFSGIDFNTVDLQTVKIAGSGKVRLEVFVLFPDHMGVDYGDLVTAVDDSVYAFADALVTARFCVQHRNIRPKYRVATLVKIENRHTWCMLVEHGQRVNKSMEYEEYRYLHFLYGQIWNPWNGVCGYLLVKKSGRGVRT